MPTKHFIQPKATEDQLLGRGSMKGGKVNMLPHVLP